MKCVDSYYQDGAKMITANRIPMPDGFKLSLISTDPRYASYLLLRLSHVSQTPALPLIVSPSVLFRSNSHRHTINTQVTMFIMNNRKYDYTDDCSSNGKTMIIVIMKIQRMQLENSKIKK